MNLIDRLRQKPLLLVIGVLLLVAIGIAAIAGRKPSNPTTAPSAVKPALTVTATTPEALEWPQTLATNGNVAAWQEAVIGAEVSNYRITEVRANVGDTVRKGQIMARIDSATVASEVAEARSTVAELQATLSEARANSERARQLRDKGFYSPQQSTQSLTAEQTAHARLDAARARLQAAELRLSKTTVVAPDDGIVSARTATVGSLTQPGQELFRLIRGGRLEWRAEVTAGELGRLKPGQPATLTAPNGAKVRGIVRIVAPTVDAQTRNALVYVDLPLDAAWVVGAGMFARGEFELGQQAALTLPQASVLLREGFAYVFRLESENGETAKVALSKITTGRRLGERIEILGLDPQARVVASGAGFLADGDTVRIVAAPTQAAAK